mmetsp:Transcript_19134/g.35772  ORF Transcript_19134/g.35772 Transcript_19134/m.35772 type:complete len:94 (+) Transcript_19134:852-1133(+)
MSQFATPSEVCIFISSLAVYLTKGNLTQDCCATAFPNPSCIKTYSYHIRCFFCGDSRISHQIPLPVTPLDLTISPILRNNTMFCITPKNFGIN